jgi:hypothetical protein
MTPTVISLWEIRPKDLSQIAVGGRTAAGHGRGPAVRRAQRFFSTKRTVRRCPLPPAISPVLSDHVHRLIPRNGPQCAVDRTGTKDWPRFASSRNDDLAPVHCSPADRDGCPSTVRTRGRICPVRHNAICRKCLAAIVIVRSTDPLQNRRVLLVAQPCSQ